MVRIVLNLMKIASLKLVAVSVVKMQDSGHFGALFCRTPGKVVFRLRRANPPKAGQLVLFPVRGQIYVHESGRSCVKC